MPITTRTRKLPGSPPRRGPRDLRRGFPKLACIACALWLAAPLASWAESDGAASSLPGALQRVLAAHSLPADSTSLYVHEIGASAPLLEINADTPRNPASTMKLLTTYAALEILGPAHTWKTELFALGPVRDGVLNGDLLIKGYGDPYLVTERLWLLQRGLRLKGLKDINGDLLIDGSYFSLEQGDPGAFDGQRYRVYNALPAATLVNFHSTGISFTANRSNGRVEITFDPALPNLRVRNRLELSDGRCGGYQRGISLHVRDTDAGGTVTFSGRFPAACGSYWMGRSMMSTDAFIYGVFKGMWEESGGTLAGGPGVGVAPEGRPFFRFRSPPLGEIVRSINKHSNNVMTRQLLLSLGAQRFEPPGTRLKGIAAVREWLMQKGLDFPELVLDNGAGLSRVARLSARSMGQLLLAADESAFRPELVASMPLSAMDGTLRKRFRHDGMAGKLHVKTGRLDHVFAMAGYAITQSGQRFVVVSMQGYEDVHRGAGEQFQDALVRWLYYR